MADNRKGGNIVEKAKKGVQEPVRHVNAVKKGKDIVMVYGIKSFCRI